MAYLCPLCKQSVSKAAYDKIIAIWTKTQRLQEDMKRDLNEREAKLKQQYAKKVAKTVLQKTKSFTKQLSKERQLLVRATKNAAARIERIKHQTARQERKRVTKELKTESKQKLKQAEFNARVNAEKKSQKKIDRLEYSQSSFVKQMGALNKNLADLRVRNRELEKELARRTTPQVEGLLYEGNLVAALKKQFPEDLLEHTGKVGDIVHTIRHKDHVVGKILYECKRVRKFKSDHLKQAAEAKLARKADYGILVTTAQKKGHQGFSSEKGILIVHPAGVLALVSLLRESLIKIANLKLTQAQRDVAVQKTIEYVESAEFKNGLDAIIEETRSLYAELSQERKEHVKVWEKRWKAYKKMFEEATKLQQKTAALLAGKELAALVREVYPDLSKAEQ
jgi:hypothetical protein